MQEYFHIESEWDVKKNDKEAIKITRANFGKILSDIRNELRIQIRTAREILALDKDNVKIQDYVSNLENELVNVYQDFTLFGDTPRASPFKNLPADLENCRKCLEELADAAGDADSKAYKITKINGVIPANQKNY